MKKTEIKEKLLEYIQQSRCIQARRDKIDDDPLHCLPLSLGKKLLLIKVYDDFLFDGYKILRFKDLTEVRYNDIDQFAEQILISEGLVCEDEYPAIKNLDNWKSTFLELKEADKNIIIELEDYEGDGLSFFIGKIIEVNNDSISFHNFNAIGEWDEEPEEIFYNDISLVAFDDRYSRIISKYVKQK